MRQRIQPAAGFTLVEMLLVLTLVGTAVGFSIESVRNYRQLQRARAAAAQLVEVLDTARSRAVTHDQVVVVEFAPEGLATSDRLCEIRVDLHEGRTREPGNDAARPSDATERGGTIGHRLPAGPCVAPPDGVATGPLGVPTAGDGVTFTDDRISFFPDGSASEAGHVTLMDPKGRTFAVALTPGGAVRVYRLNGSTWK